VFATYLDDDADNVDLLRKLGMKVFYGDASRHKLLHAAGAQDAQLIIIAMDNPEHALKVVHTVQKHFPHLKIMARAKWLYDTYELIDHGISMIYRETLETSLRMAADALCTLGHRRNQVYRAMKMFRKHDEAYLRELAAMRHDHSELLRETKQRIEDLEKLMITELENIGKNKDLDWDTTTLINEIQKLEQNKPS